MGSLYYPWADIARDAGLVVRVTGTNSGWEQRARSSGGFSAPPIAVMWHHAASSTSTSDEACVNYQVRGNPDNPVGNMTLGRNGDLWPVAGGASNCSGKGGPMSFSRGTCPKDSGNTYFVNVEVNQNGLGEPWSTQLIDAYFALSNALNAYLGNKPTDITSHALGAGDGYTDRKIDPATAAAVQGLWKPRSTNSSGTWNLADMRSECSVRAGTAPGPTPPSPTPGPSLKDDDTMLRAAKNKDTGNTFVLGDGKSAQTMDGLDSNETALRVAGGVIDVSTKKVVYSWSNVTPIASGDVKKYVGAY